MYLGIIEQNWIGGIGGITRIRGIGGIMGCIEAYLALIEEVLFFFVNYIFSMFSIRGKCDCRNRTSIKFRE